MPRQVLRAIKRLAAPGLGAREPALRCHRGSEKESERESMSITDRGQESLG